MNSAFLWLSNLIRPFEKVDSPPPQSLWRFFGWNLSGAWPVLIVTAVISTLTGITEIASAWLLGRVVDSASGDPIGYFQENFVLVLVFFGFYLGYRPLAFGLNALFQSLVVSPQVAAQSTVRLHRWTLTQPISFFDDDFAGRIAQKQAQTSAALTNVVTETLNVGFFALASVLGGLWLVAGMNLWLAAAMTVWIGLYIGLLWWFLPRMRARARYRAAARAVVSGQIADTITNIKTVKLFANASHEDRVALDAMAVFREKMLHFGATTAMFRLVIMTLAGLLPIILIGGSVLLWRAEQVTPGEIATAGAIAIRLSQMTGWVSFTLMGVYSNLGEVEDGMRTLTPRPTVVDRPDAVPFQPATGAVQFENLSYTYGGGLHGIHDVTLTLKPGEKVGIVGASGAGKSTLVALLLRLYDPEEGRILLDGQDLQDVQQESARQHIGMVTQDTAMFNRSARDNIRYGRPDASQTEVEDAAKRAEAHEFIAELADAKGREGYDAHLGERGVKLSGGQRQRIALARAILKDAPILVLDEATSALDSEVEAQIQAALQEVMDGKTVLAIAHRLSTLANMDRIIVMDQGRIVEDGTHAALLAQGGFYARYWDRQSGGFLTPDAAE